MLPDMASIFQCRYESDAYGAYVLSTPYNQYDSLSPAGDITGLVPLPWYIVPRHWVCLFSDGTNVAYVKVLCPLPFNQSPSYGATIINTSGGVAYTILGRQGEVAIPYDYVAI